MLGFTHMLGQRGMHSKAKVYVYIYNCAKRNIGKQIWKLRKERLINARNLPKGGEEAK